MPKIDYALFIGAESELYHTEFIANTTFFLIYSAKSDSEKKPEIKHIFKKAHEAIEEKKPADLASFEILLDELVIQKLKHEGGGLAAALLVDSVLYLKTYGAGEILLKRGLKFGHIVSNGLSASGLVQMGDTVVFTNSMFLSLIDAKLLQEKMSDQSPKETVETITPLIKMNDDSGAIAMFLHIGAEAIEETSIEETTIEEPHHETQEVLPTDAYGNSVAADTLQDMGYKKPSPFDAVKNKIIQAVATFSQYQQGSSKNKKLTLIAVVIIFIILIWSVGFGIQRRNKAELQKAIQHSQEVIDQKIQEATDVSGLNVERSQMLLTDAQTEFETIKKKAGKNETGALQKMSDKLATAGNSIVKKEDKKAQVFYDLKLINSSAKANYMYKDKTNALLLNGGGKEAYIVDLSKKSVKTYKKDELTGATIGAIYNDTMVFYVPSKGIYSIDKTGKVIQVIQNDNDWGTIADMAIYNGNLYVLDSGKSDVYKYLVAENGYSEKKSYFKDGQKIAISGNATIAIDSSLYLVTTKKAYKFVTGVRDTFNVQFPDSGTHVFDRVVTDKTTSNVYLLDKANGKVYILSKTGQYEKQIESSIFKQADGITVFDDAKSIYVLVGDKIYSIAL